MLLFGFDRLPLKVREDTLHKCISCFQSLTRGIVSLSWHAFIQLQLFSLYRSRIATTHFVISAGAKRDFSWQRIKRLTSYSIERPPLLYSVSLLIVSFVLPLAITCASHIAIVKSLHNTTVYMQRSSRRWSNKEAPPQHRCSMRHALLNWQVCRRNRRQRRRTLKVC